MSHDAAGARHGAGGSRPRPERVEAGPAGAGRVTLAPAHDRPSPGVPRAAPEPVELVVNGAPHRLAVAPEAPLLHVLRNDLRLNGPKYGCGLGECGACAVLVDGIEARACVIPLGGVAGRAITTLEGLAPGGALHPVQQAFIDAAAAQCGYCLNGMIVATVALLRRLPDPSEAQIRSALAHNLCRCGAHLEILKAVRMAAAAMRTAAVEPVAPAAPAAPAASAAPPAPAAPAASAASAASAAPAVSSVVQKGRAAPRGAAEAFASSRPASERDETPRAPTNGFLSRGAEANRGPCGALEPRLATPRRQRRVQAGTLPASEGAAPRRSPR